MSRSVIPFSGMSLPSTFLRVLISFPIVSFSALIIFLFFIREITRLFNVFSMFCIVESFMRSVKMGRCFFYDFIFVRAFYLNFYR